MSMSESVTVKKVALDEAAAVCDREEDIVAFVREIFTRVGDKWSLRVLDELTKGTLRFTPLMEALSPISHRVLTSTLRNLETDGMVSRTAYAESPPRVEYSLTPLGASFLSGALPLVAWAQDNRQKITAHRTKQNGGS
jgi:DNA-binding HxlR family transcriptional regulator